MKQAIKNVRTITMGLMTLCFLGVTNASFAGAKEKDPVELRYIGTIKNHPAIQLDLNNSNPGVYFINIKSMDYHILYSEIVDGTNLSRIYRLNLQDALSTSNAAVRVEVTSEKTHQTKVYIVNTSNGVVNDAVTAK
ncbi:MAG: hypothetical protein KGM98_14380 [Bacteroidota bacterium]|nr:hypothetical protein [Bacteroidota bacterium]